jgi:agmatine deiminase
VTIFIATSYLNFLVTNDIVLMSSYWKPGRPEIMKQKDQQAENILKQAFPGRRVITLNVEVLNESGGGIHCATQQQPAVN